MTDELFNPSLRERLNFYAKRLRPGAQSFLRMSKREASELSALLADAEHRIAEQDEMINALHGANRLLAGADELGQFYKQREREKAVAEAAKNAMEN